ncbi:MAG: hypothetical protein M2R45_02922 [Verrucomicrobia subdivision 3 bacterium]|nr:hypothetical protein [Limisphaerales bacterium]MCS1415356.1 hypothetical protein [Limisphaerales bacterium]
MQHSHNPPDYLVIEPEDTTARTRNLQQTNTNGYKWQGTHEEFFEATSLVNEWGDNARKYQPTPEYQAKLRELIAEYPYRLDTNFAKMNRIGHDGISRFKDRVLSIEHHGKTIRQWTRLFGKGNEANLQKALEENLEITEVGSEGVVR